MSKAPFLRQIAEHYYRLLGSEISKHTFVFPSRRALLFFRHYLGQIADKPIFAPECTTVNDFIVSLLPERRLLDRTALLFELYHSYAETRGDCLTESFDEFIYWGNIILKDFDLIDRYLISARELYTNIHDFKELQDDFSYMQESTLDILKDFWGKFEGLGIRSELMLNAKPSSRERFLDFWRSLYPLYEHFNTRLREEGYGYEGGIYRAIAEDAVDIVDSLSGATALVFVGLFENTPAEFRLFQALRRRGYAEFCWDEQVHILLDEKHRAHQMMRKNKELLGYVRGSWSTASDTLPKSVDVISCASTVSQVKALPQVLNSLGIDLESDTGTLDLTTAIILPNDNLLLPTVGSIPDSYRHLNITLGYPLNRTPVAIMLKRWIDLLEQQQAGAYRVDKLMALLSLQLFVERFPSLSALIERINRQRNFRLSREWLYEEYVHILEARGATEGERHEPVLDGYQHILELLLNDECGALGFLSALKALLHVLLTSSRLVGVEPESSEVPDLFAEVDTRPELGIFDAEFIHHYILLVNRLHTLIERYGQQAMSLMSAAKMLEGLSQGFTIPFEGSPLQGLQIMGLLESRLLHFRHLIYLSAQEGLMPSDRGSNTLIPYAIRAGYHLPTPELIEVAESYRFYQAISGVERLVLLYGKEDSTGGKGEESRYILQLEYLYNVPIRRLTAQASPHLRPYMPIVIHKDRPEVKEQLARYFSTDEDAKALSASRLATYISCPLRFYYEALMEVYEEQPPQELMAANDFGSILHKTMEQLYAPYMGGKLVPKEYIQYLLTEGNTQVSRTIKGIYDSLYGRKKLNALDKLYCEMIDTYVQGILQYDLHSEEEFAYIASECRFRGKIELSDGRMVHIKGDIDRIDVCHSANKEPRLRLIDYKTGKDSLERISSWEKLTTDEAYKARMQILLYCELVYSGVSIEAGGLSASHSYPIQPAIMLVRNMVKAPTEYSPYLRFENTEIDDYKLFRDNYLEVLRALLDEIFNPEQPFVQTKDFRSCTYCPFKLSCGR